MRSELGQVADRRGKPLLGRVVRPRAFFARARGLLGRRGLGADEGLWLERCNSIHMFGMRFPIDVVFLRQGAVVRLCRGVAPMQARWCRAADTVLELAAGSIDRLGLSERDALSFQTSQ